MQHTGPVRIEHREPNRVRPFGWHAKAFDTVYASLIAEGARGEVVLVSVETGEVLLRRPLPGPKPARALPDDLSSAGPEG